MPSARWRLIWSHCGSFAHPFWTRVRVWWVWRPAGVLLPFLGENAGDRGGKFGSSFCVDTEFGPVGPRCLGFRAPRTRRMLSQGANVKGFRFAVCRRRAPCLRFFGGPLGALRPVNLPGAPPPGLGERFIVFPRRCFFAGKLWGSFRFPFLNIPNL